MAGLSSKKQKPKASRALIIKRKGSKRSVQKDHTDLCLEYSVPGIITLPNVLEPDQSWQAGSRGGRCDK